MPFWDLPTGVDAIPLAYLPLPDLFAFQDDGDIASIIRERKFWREKIHSEFGKTSAFQQSDVRETYMLLHARDMIRTGKLFDLGQECLPLSSAAIKRLIYTETEEGDLQMYLEGSYLAGSKTHLDLKHEYTRWDVFPLSHALYTGDADRIEKALAQKNITSHLFLHTSGMIDASISLSICPQVVLERLLHSIMRGFSSLTLLEYFLVTYREKVTPAEIHRCIEVCISTKEDCYGYMFTTPSPLILNRRYMDRRIDIILEATRMLRAYTV